MHPLRQSGFASIERLGTPNRLTMRPTRFPCCQHAAPMHTKVVLPYGHADGVVGSVRDSEPAAAEVARTGSIGYG